eukprot:2478194-Rhodomonas_salina.2
MGMLLPNPAGCLECGFLYLISGRREVPWGMACYHPRAVGYLRNVRRYAMCGTGLGTPPSPSRSDFAAFGEALAAFGYTPDGARQNLMPACDSDQTDPEPGPESESPSGMCHPRRLLLRWHPT